MKTCKRIFAALLVLSCVFLLASCGKFGSIKKNFEDAGYTYVEVADDDEDAKNALAIVAELEEGEVSCTLHIFKKSTVDVGALTLYKFAFVFEFKSDADLQKAFEEDGSNTLKGLIKDFQNSEYVNGNCILLPTLIDNNEKLEIFNKS